MNPHAIKISNSVRGVEAGIYAWLIAHPHIVRLEVYIDKRFPVRLIHKVWECRAFFTTRCPGHKANLRCGSWDSTCPSSQSWRKRQNNVGDSVIDMELSDFNETITALENLANNFVRASTRTPSRRPDSSSKLPRSSAWTGRVVRSSTLSATPTC